MIVDCPHCEAKYRLNPEQMAGREEVTVRCTKCGTRFGVSAAELQAARGETPGWSADAGEPELPADKYISLVVTGGPLKGEIFRLTKPRVVVGRQGADVVVGDTEVSRKHCMLEVRGIRARLLDLGSTNGTYVNGERVEAAELEHSGEFRIGATTLLFSVSVKEE